MQYIYVATKDAIVPSGAVTSLSNSFTLSVFIKTDAARKKEKWEEKNVMPQDKTVEEEKRQMEVKSCCYVLNARNANFYSFDNLLAEVFLVISETQL